MALLILLNQFPNHTDQRIEKLSKFFGIKTEYMAIENINKNNIKKHKIKNICCAMSINTFNLFFPENLSKQYLMEGSKIFLYPDNYNESTKTFYSIMGLELSLNNIRFKEIKFVDNKINGVLSTIKITSKNDRNFLSLNSNKSVEPLIDVDNRTTFFKIRLKNTDIYFSGFTVIDIDKIAYGPISLRDDIDGYIPLLIYLKHNMKDEIWHKNTIEANLIIDDPHLKINYGFINFKKLLQETYSENIKVTIGFVPINYKKVSKSTTELLRRTDNIGVCVHGCTHTSNEFAGNNYNKLVRKALASKYLMDIFHVRYKINPVLCMVFPQGVFSSEAIRALKRTNYIAAINSHYNINLVGNNENKLKLKDFFTPAVISINGLPVYHRRIPDSEAVHFKLSAFLGKPIFLVQHHEDFQNGYEKLKNAVKKINDEIPKLQWTSLEKILKKCYWEKTNNDGSISLWLFSREIIIYNNEKRKIKYTIYFCEKNNDDLDLNIYVDKQPIMFKTERERVKFFLYVDPKKTASIMIKYETKKYKEIPISKKDLFIANMRSKVKDAHVKIITVLKTKI